MMRQRRCAAILPSGSLRRSCVCAPNFVILLAEVLVGFRPADSQLVLPVVNELPVEDVGIDHLPSKMEDLVVFGDGDVELETLSLVAVKLPCIRGDVGIRSLVSRCLEAGLDRQLLPACDLVPRAEVL